MEPEKKKEPSALERINKITTAICAFLLVLFVNDMRSSMSDIKADMKQISTSYIDLNTRVTIIEYSMGIKPKPGGTSFVPQKGDSLLAHNAVVFTKPEEYELKGKAERHTQ